jgi:hypothetical protein
MARRLAVFLKETVERESNALWAISDEEAAEKPSGESWSRREELGHLLDSAANNRVRFVRGALEPGGFSMPSYDSAGWVAMQGYRDLPWPMLVDLWQRENALLAHVVDRIPDERLSTLCGIGGGAPVTLEFLIEDYVRHMQHHLDHILRRKTVTHYPGA